MSEKRFGKSFGDLNSMKRDFFENNDGRLKMADWMADVLNAQPERKVCKICGAPLPGKFYTSHNIDYIICEKCGHLNSAREDTDDFATSVYVEDDYSKNYSMDNREGYEKRLELIYIPKARFMKECLYKDGVREIKDLDIGAGCGYFVNALKRLDIEAFGVDVSENEVRFGNEMSGEEILKCVGLRGTIDYIKESDANVVSAIGVLEHLIDLEDNLKAIKENKNIRYLYASVPMFSFSSCFEAAFQDCWNRHTGGTHTHQFSNESILKMAEFMGFELAYEWRFGSDINDLYRFLMVMMQKNGNDRLADLFSERFVPVMDRLQLILDESEFSSELHFILRRRQ